MKKILYITYDGLTDPLGQSQILPYVIGLAKYGFSFTILSFEKKVRFRAHKNLIDTLIKSSNIQWVPLIFTTRPPLLSKLYDAVRMQRKAIQLHSKQQFDMVHCRSYIAADVGLYMKKNFRVKFYFDMRGFWADEKKDGGSWDTTNPLFNQVYKYYKKKEAAYLQNADYIISLTEKGKNELCSWRSYNKQTPVSVIPCCADMNHFTLTDPKQKALSRALLGISENALVISYLGSIGTWYMIDEMLQFFKLLKDTYKNAKFIFVTHSEPSLIEKKAADLQLKPENFIIKEASRNEVPNLIKASDINISFIKPVYSKISSSPTKLGEVLSMGIPVICNSGIGDVENIITTADAGYIVQGFSKGEFEMAIESVPQLLKKDPKTIRSNAEKIYSLDKGIDLYLKSYQLLFAPSVSRALQ